MMLTQKFMCVFVSMLKGGARSDLHSPHTPKPNCGQAV